jgi:Ca2+-binding RTX toxin-like protein
MSVSMCGCGQCSAMWMGAGGSQTGTITIVNSSPPPVSPPPLYPAQPATAVFSTFSSNTYVRGLQFGTQWSGGDIRYTFPTSLSNYESNYGDPAALGGASTATGTQMAAVRDILGSDTGSPSAYFRYGSFASIVSTNIYELSTTSGVNGAEIRIANTTNAQTAYAYYPSTNPAGGDVWIGSNYTASLQSPILGSYGWMTHVHELGHAMGLKHAHEASPYNSTIVPSDRDGMEFTVMSYRSYIGQPIQGYANETYGFAQTLMMYDIAALQFIYGADFSTNSTATTYTWNPLTGAMSLNGVSQGTPGANRIFLTTWDGGGTDTYDLSNYSTNLSIDLTPGGWSTFSQSQLASLDVFNGTGSKARGNVYNALLHNNDARSYIENAIGGTGNDVIVGNDIANVLSGGSGADTLLGGAGADTLDGGLGTDTLVGGVGDDIYVVDTSDSITELVNEGVDLVRSSSASFSLSANVENLTLVAGSAAVSGTGNGLDNVIIGNERDNNLNGGAGADTMSGGSGNDTYDVDNVGDIVTELSGGGLDSVVARLNWTLSANVENLTMFGAATVGTGNDLNNVISGNTSDDTLTGLGGNDILRGNAGNDTMIGDVGNDTYAVGSIGDVIVELVGEGTDTVETSISYVLGDHLENLTLFGFGDGLSIDGTGNSLANVITGDSGNNRLDGGLGADALAGGAGNDTYVVDNIGDTVTELSNAGTDLVHSSLSFTLGANFENLTLVSGAGSIDGTGNSLANVIAGNEGNNRLDGGTGIDTLIGGAGNDVYVVDNLGDTVTEQSSEGTDLVQSSVTFTLGANVENLTMMSSGGSIAGTGNALANVLLGNQGHNTLSGLGGNDTLNGGAGNDVLDGGAGFDTAVFAGLRSDYQVIWDYDVVKLVRSGETDALYNVEQVSFSDGLASIDSFGPAPTVVETAGATQLVNLGVRSYLLDSGGAGPSLKYQGAPVVAGQFGAAWTAIGAEQVTGGYQIAFKNGTQDQYAVWNVDGNGNMLDMPAGALSGASTTLQLLETTFQQDLNGNGQIGLVPVTIESFGSTRLVQLGSQFFLQDSGGAGPSLKYQGAAVVAGQFGAAWAAIGAEQVGGGYQVVFKNGSADQYVAWNLDSNGNYASSVTGMVAGSDTTLQTLETTFQQDLNGNGQTGLVPVTIESFGSTRLVQLGSQFFLQDSGGAGPSLKHQGAVAVAGQFGAAWAAIGAEQVGGGYQVVFKNGSADQYVVWNVDSNGNMLDMPAGVLSGASTTLRALETTFQQDLNGSGQIGANGYLAVDQLVQAIAGFAPTPSSQTAVSSDVPDSLVLPLVSNWTQPQG